MRWKNLILLILVILVLTGCKEIKQNTTKETVKECVAYTDGMSGALNSLCETKADCTAFFTEMQVPQSEIDQFEYECVETSWVDYTDNNFRAAIVCSSDQDCHNKILKVHMEEEDMTSPNMIRLKQAIRCRDQVCKTTKNILNSIGSGKEELV